MDTEPAFGFEQLVMTAVAEMATAVSVRNGEGQQQQRARFQTAAHMIMGFQPRDGIEMMLAGHCTMMHEMMIIDVCHSLRSEPGTTQRTLVALNKAFNDTLDRLERYRQRPAEGQRDAPEASPAAEAAPVEFGSQTRGTRDEPRGATASRPGRAARRRNGVATAGAARRIAACRVSLQRRGPSGWRNSRMPLQPRGNGRPHRRRPHRFRPCPGHCHTQRGVPGGSKKAGQPVRSPDAGPVANGRSRLRSNQIPTRQTKLLEPQIDHTGPPDPHRIRGLAA